MWVYGLTADSKRGAKEGSARPKRHEVTRGVQSTKADAVESRGTTTAKVRRDRPTSAGRAPVHRKEAQRHCALPTERGGLTVNERSSAAGGGTESRKADQHPTELEVDGRSPRTYDERKAEEQRRANRSQPGWAAER